MKTNRDGDGENSRVGKRCVLSRWFKEARRPITIYNSGSRQPSTMRIRGVPTHSEDLDLSSNQRHIEVRVQLTDLPVFAAVLCR